MKIKTWEICYLGSSERGVVRLSSDGNTIRIYWEQLNAAVIEFAIIYELLFKNGQNCPTEFVFDNGSKQELALEVSAFDSPGGTVVAKPSTSQRFEASIPCASCRSNGRYARVYCGLEGCRAN